MTKYRFERRESQPVIVELDFTPAAVSVLIDNMSVLRFENTGLVALYRGDGEWEALGFLKIGDDPRISPTLERGSTENP